MTVKDLHGRSFRKLRISLLDACNYRCTYCMPENIKFNDKNLMSSVEIQDVTKNLLKYGIEEVRLTGGEPCLRKDLLEIVNKLSELDISRLGITTNAHLLYPKLRELQQTKLKSINISLDSLNGEKFHKITKFNGLEKVLSSIFLAQELGFNVKVNTVVMKGINDDEILDFVDFANTNKLEVRFLELMKIGVVNQSFKNNFVDASSMISKIKNSHQMELIKVELDSTSFKYKVGQGIIGFIASESRPFCGNCSRLRLTSKGELRSCLMKENGINVRNTSSEGLRGVLQQLINAKPSDRIESISQNMHEIGG